MFDADTIVLLAKLYLIPSLVVAAGVVGSLVLLSNKLSCRPLIRFFAAIAGAAGLAVCNPVLIILSGLIGLIIEGDLGVLRRGPPLFPFCRDVFLLLWAPAAIFGAIIGLMVYTGTCLWRGVESSRLRTALGLLLILLTWLILGSGLMLEMLFIGATSQ